jgi:hypothetical protein
MMRAGLPTAVAPGGTGLVTTALLPMRAPVAHREAAQHLRIGAHDHAAPSVGWRLAPLTSEVPPSVTPW